ncbi:TPA_asm: hypothetical protein CBHJFHIM_00011 [Methanobrevibacter gottschalkii virus vir075]|uniref:Uncharacterized protein n=1 Tax=Methanobrevibacter gottschalkii TaxID=190974 RepID=A0A1H7I6F5_9EURY|nr:hypothetical protein [Methanobrevibacter gottschalkii]SEK57402.1 hypothetical protein SAMN05216439_1145 [Methanobrevibacter gottschalkii]
MSSSELINVNTVPDVDTAIEQWNVYQRLCGKKGILDENDFQKIMIKEKDPATGEYVSVEREFKKKSAWQKLGRAFNVDTRIVTHEFMRTKTGRINEAYYCVCATLPNGRSVESDALCSRSERGKQKVSDHTIISTAKTRATNRAISELIGAGEVSSEEMTAEETANKMRREHNKKMIDVKINNEEFTTGDKLQDVDYDPVSLNYARTIKASLQQTKSIINKVSMKNRLLVLIENGDISADMEDKLLSFINEHCPEAIEEESV